MSEGVSRDVTIRLKVVADENAKASTDKLKAAIDSVSASGEQFAKTFSSQQKKSAGDIAGSFEKSFTAAYSKMDDAAKKHFDNVGRYAETAADRGRAAFEKMQASQEKAAKEPASKATVDSSATAARPVATTKPVAGQTWKAGQFVDTDNSDKVLAAQQKSIDSLDRQRSKSLEKAMRDDDKAAEQKIKTDQKTVDSLDRQRSKYYEKQLKDADRTAAKETQLIQRAADTAAAKQQAAGKAAEAAMQRVLSGAVQLGQGLAQLGILGEKDIEGLAKAFIKVQAGANVLKGGLDVFFAIREAASAARTAILATAAANVTLAAAQKAVGVGSIASGGVAAAAKGAAGGIAGQVGGGIAGAAAKGGLAAKMPTLYGLGKLALGGAATAGTAALAVGGGALGGEALSRVATGGKTGTITELVGYLRDIRQNTKQSEKISAAETARANKLNQAAERDNLIASTAQRSAGERNRQESVAQRLDSVSGTSPAEAAKKERLRALQEIDQAQAGVAAAEERRLQRQQQMQVASDADRVAAQDRLLSASERLASAEQRNLDVLKAEAEQLKAAVESRRQALEQAKSQLESEQGQTKSRSASFGQQSKATQARVLDTSERFKAAGGMEGGGLDALTRADVDLLRQSGQAGEIVNAYDAKKGEAAGSLKVQDNFGLRDKEADAFSEVQRQSGNLDQAEIQSGSASSAVAEQVKITERSIQAMDRLAAAIEKSNINGGGAVVGSQAEPVPEGPSTASTMIDASNAIASMGNAVKSSASKQADSIRRNQERMASAMNFV